MAAKDSGKNNMYLIMANLEFSTCHHIQQKMIIAVQHVM